MDEEQADLLSRTTELDFLRFILADIYNDLEGKVGRFRQLADLSGALGAAGIMLLGGEITATA